VLRIQRVEQVHSAALSLAFGGLNRFAQEFQKAAGIGHDASTIASASRTPGSS
jgi:hypothetical protein